MDFTAHLLLHCVKWLYKNHIFSPSKHLSRTEKKSIHTTVFKC